jgi:hypothetical protein
MHARHESPGANACEQHRVEARLELKHPVRLVNVAENYGQP